MHACRFAADCLKREREIKITPIYDDSRPLVTILEEWSFFVSDLGGANFLFADVTIRKKR